MISPLSFLFLVIYPPSPTAKFSRQDFRGIIKRNSLNETIRIGKQHAWHICQNGQIYKIVQISGRKIIKNIMLHG
jgi:hypothetical protein